MFLPAVEEEMAYNDPLQWKPNSTVARVQSDLAQLNIHLKSSVRFRGGRKPVGLERMLLCLIKS